MYSEAIIDYAYPCMMAEKALKDVHNAMLAKDYDQAIAYARLAFVEAKLTMHSIELMKEKEDAVCK